LVAPDDFAGRAFFKLSFPVDLGFFFVSFAIVMAGDAGRIFESGRAVGLEKMKAHAR
jgi:hypothetical protein